MKKEKIDPDRDFARFYENYFLRLEGYMTGDIRRPALPLCDIGRLGLKKIDIDRLKQAYDQG